MGAREHGRGEAGTDRGLGERRTREEQCTDGRGQGGAGRTHNNLLLFWAIIYVRIRSFTYNWAIVMLMFCSLPTEPATIMYFLR